ncbi:activating signal cointegrator 1 complex subunit 2 [Toxorhynchites rutilus septentrionalis]|uniref:activating signal cointegrator 1 complex subunit 2 n=1 Tax=Toxorhynchites rutilus septentrionalis TaxID=329112 RepID=UPI00247B21D6|nr:activating signal cointegrator 1 complex subunit 2 [Toxorhynchites rutilus septentrionalis]
MAMSIVAFENEKNLPLNELLLNVNENGIKRNIPALHEKWSESRCFSKYTPFPIKGGLVEEGAQLDQWASETEWFVKDMEWLLGLEHFRFWSTLVHNAGAIESVISFTQSAIPYYLSGVVRSSPNVFPLYSAALRRVLQVICRMITQHESDQCWIGKEYMGELLYKHYLISIPLLFDLLPVYGRENKHVLTLMLQTVFKLQPKYRQDLRVALQYLQSTFKTIQLQIETDRIDGNVATVGTLNDLAVYTLDCCSTLSLLVELYPEVRPLCSELGFEPSITNFYDNTIVLLYRNIFAKDNESPYLGYLNSARMELLLAFRSIVNLQLETILDNPNDSLLPADKFLCILTECLSDPTFVKDYQRHYPVERDLDILKQACPGLDFFKLDFVQNAYCGGEESALTNGHCEETIIPEENEGFGEATGGAVEEQSPGPSTVSAQPLSEEQKIEEQVQKVLDVLPHLGGGYVRKILSRYDGVEQAIAAVLEGNLPPDLAEADPTEPFIPADKLDSFFLETGIQRLNVYDGDEFDVMVHDTVKGVIKKGKGMPGGAKNLQQMLDDKSHVKEMKNRYQEYTNVCDDYDDEYDDSYDAMADSESKKIRLTAEMRNALVDELDDDEEEPEDEAPVGAPEKKPLDFCENPEVVRQRYEERRRSKFPPRQSGKPSEKDVVGKPKGQGQDTSVLQNRKHKGENKASRANHNRKQGATFKRNKGMIPS